MIFSVAVSGAVLEYENTRIFHYCIKLKCILNFGNQIFYLITVMIYVDESWNSSATRAFLETSIELGQV